MKRVLPVLLCLASIDLCGQAARLVMQNGAYIQFPTHTLSAPVTTSTYLVIENPSPTAITTVGAAGGNIVTEHQLNKVRWMNGGAAVGAPNTFIVPFTTPSGVKIPVSVYKTAAGSVLASNSMVFSTHSWRSVAAAAGSEWDNSGYMPTGVTHMNANVAIPLNNSNNVIDRFWIVDTKDAATGAAYAVNPALNLSFTFDPADAAHAGNIAGLSSTLQAQRFNTTQNKWGDYGPMGTLTGNSVINIGVPVDHVFRVWTLSNGGGSPLPIELISWSGACENGDVTLKWSTASEINNSFFAIERSDDANDWRTIGIVEGAGNSTSRLDYSFVDAYAPAMGYYRLRQTDYDGVNEVSVVIAAGCKGEDGITIVNAWDDLMDLNVVVSASFGGVYELTLLDAQGRTLTVRPSQVVNEGATQLKIDKNGIAPGIYTIMLHNNDRVLSRRLMVN